MASTIEPKNSTQQLGAMVVNPTVTMEPPSDDVSLGKRFFNRRTLLSFVAAFALLAWFFTRQGLDFGAVWAHLRSANPWLFLAATTVYFLAFPVRGLRWRILLNNVGLHNEGGRLPSVWGLSEIILIGWFANCIVPAKLGDAYRAYMLKRAAQVSFSTTAGTVVAERLIDMIVLFGLLCIPAITFIGGANQRNALLVVGLGFGMFLAIVLGIIGMRLFGERLHYLLPERLQPMYLRFHQGTLGSFRQIPLLVGLTILVWLLESSRMYLVAQSLNIPIDFSFVVFAALANSLLTVVPFTPGGLGLVENSSAELFRWAGVPKELAFSLILLDRGISYWGVILSGFAVFLVSKKK